ncbi:hypothetical protein GIB67_001085 [Kingdonia uniflora]|uniref:25S rRNA (uridine-N(3))-methyltransferase BMT5-like domain-containing protein n=1 Tax=Kingdonia uniflora TaxID=39325 RepID=A0A7J7MGB0_9MAGN|nr:hypothetical protein GIB67_001085 [Kingdonia uniflora]
MVNATTMADDCILGSMKFDRIVFNFPHAGFDKSLSRHQQIWQHQKLVFNFFMNAKRMLSDGGEIHVVHKCYGFFLEWNIVMLAAYN